MSISGCDSIPPEKTAAAQHPVPANLTSGQLPKRTDVSLLVITVCMSAAVLALMGKFSIAGSIVAGVIIFLIAIYALSYSVEGRRRATNRLARYLIFSTFVLALIPLISLLFDVVSRGLARFDLDYFTMSKRNIVGAGGGASHAITGTLIVTGIAALISIPIGLLTAIYLVEYGHGPAKRIITFLVDVMTGIPSIVAGLFAYGLFAFLFSPGSKSGLAGAVALSVLMIPYVVRSSEEIIRLVPNTLREASHALGVNRWRTIVKVVLPTSISGIVSGTILAIARVIGETAPLLISMGYTDSLVTDPLPSGGAQNVNPMTALPVFVYYEYTRPGKPQDAFFDRAWTGALVLVLIVMALNIIGRIVAKKFAPKINR